MEKKKERSKIEKMVYDCYEELYQNSTPKVSFYELLKKAKKNKDGKKIIPYKDHIIGLEEYKKIVDKHIDKNKLGVYQARSFEFEMYLGCGPTTKVKEV